MFDDFKKFDKEFNESMNISLEGNKKKRNSQPPSLDIQNKSLNQF